MDYDDSDSQSQNLRLAGEGSTGFSPVLRPYALPKFDFDESLQGHLRFDSLVDTEVFLGIESQEDNHWIEDFSRGNSGIEFSPSAAESCSISRRNNAWSEATSSESVEMLLKSVGQEEMIPGQTIIEESDAHDEQGTLTTQIEPSLKQGDNIVTQGGHIVDSPPTLLAGKLVGSFLQLNEDVGGKLPQVEDALQTHEGDSSAYGSSSSLNPSAVAEKCSLPVCEGSLLNDSKCNADSCKDAFSVHESPDIKTEEFSATGKQVDSMVTNTQNIITGTVELNSQEASSHVNDVSNENANGLQRDNCEGREDCNVLSDNQSLVVHAVESCAYNSENATCMVSGVNSVLSGNVVETSSNKVEEPSVMMSKGESELQMAEGCKADVCSRISVQASKCEVVGLSEDKERDNIYEGDTHDDLPMASESDGRSKDEVGNCSVGLCATLGMKMDSAVQHSQNSVLMRKEGSLEGDHQRDNDTLVGKTEASLLSVEDNKFSICESNGSVNSNVESDPHSTLACPSAELLGRVHANENFEDSHDSPRIHREEDKKSSSILDDSLPISKQNVVSRKIDVHDSDQDAFVIEKGEEKFPNDYSNVECHRDGSIAVGMGLGSTSLGKGSMENESKSHSDPPAGHELDVDLEDANLASCGTLEVVRVPLPLKDGATINEIDEEHNEKSPLPIVGSDNLDSREETAAKMSTQESLSNLKNCSQEDGPLSTLKDCSQENSPLDVVSEQEKGALNDTAGQLLHTVDESPAEVEMFNVAVAGKSKAPEVSKDSQELSEEFDGCLGAGNGDGAGGPILENNEEAIKTASYEENNEEEIIEASSEEPSLKVSDAEPISDKSELLTLPAVSSSKESNCGIGQEDQEDKETNLAIREGKCEQTPASSSGGDASNADEGCLSPVGQSEGDAKSSLLEGGNVSEDSHKSNCDPPVVCCTELSQDEKQLQEGIKGPADQNISGCKVSDGAADKVCSISADLKANDSSKYDKGFTFEVTPLTDLSERETGKGWQPFSTIQQGKISGIVEGSPASSLSQMDSKLIDENFCGTPPTSGVQVKRGGSKSTPVRKPRRASGKATGKETAKKVNSAKEMTPVKQSEMGSISGNVPPITSVTCQLVQSEGVSNYGHVEHSGTKPSGVLTALTSNLPDLNASASPSLVFQQPFTDLQQVQLRAQIFVYGSLIQGAVPDEACMVSAFGATDGGRSIWENAWRASIDRLHSQKSHPSNTETPLQSRTELVGSAGARSHDQAGKQGALQSKITPIGRASNKGTPATFVNSMTALSSPLWSMSSPCDSLQQSSPIPRGAVLDYHQSLSPLIPYQTPPLRNFVGHNTSWISQAPFPVPWVASQQTSALDASARFSTVPITETVRLTPVRESSVPHSSSIKHVSLGPVIHSGGQASVVAGASSSPDTKKVTSSPSQQTVGQKSRKRKKIPVNDSLGQITLLSQTQAEVVPASGVTGHLSTSIAVSTPARTVSNTDVDMAITTVSPVSSTANAKTGNHDTEQSFALSEETLSKVKEAKLQAEEASAHAAAAVMHSQGIWSQMEKRKNAGLVSDVEAKLASAAVAIAAAASIAKAAAAAAEIASNAALQAKLMADEALVSTGAGNSNRSDDISLSDDVNNLGKATPASILKGVDGTSCATSIIVAAREAARRKVEAASAASKRAENLDAIVKAAELAAEAVSQAGKIVAMGDPLPLSELVKTGPEGYQKVPQVSSEQFVKSNLVRQQLNVELLGEGPDNFAKNSVGPLEKRRALATSHGVQSAPSDAIRELAEDRVRLVDGLGSGTNDEMELAGQKGRKVSDSAKTIGVVPESEFVSRPTSITANIECETAEDMLKENNIKEGSLVEVFKDGDGYKAAWFSANVLSLKDGKACVCYTELPSDEGSGQLKEWVALKGEGDNAPRIRIARSATTTQFEGTRKRRRAVMGNYTWSVGDRVDAWVQECWWEGVVTEKNKKDETALTVHFPAQGETSVVRAWNLRPSLIWKDGEWTEWSSSGENDSSNREGDTPREKRPRLGSPAVEVKGKDKTSKNFEMVDSGKPEGSKLLALSVNDKVFNVGKNSKNDGKPNTLKTIRTGLQKEGSRVVFGIPKPGKKRKFMEVSKHYVANQSTKINEANDSVKLSKFLMPQGSRGASRVDLKEKRAAESKAKVPKSGKQQNASSRTTTQKYNLLTSTLSASQEDTSRDDLDNIKDSISQDENAIDQQNLKEFGSFANAEGAAEGPILFSSLPLPQDAPGSKKMSTSTAKSARVSKGKLAPAGGKLARIQEDKIFNGNSGKSTSEVVEPRRSNRRIQPTSRLLEGLQSSMIISKIPSVSHDKGHKSQSRGVSRGINHG
ncbi:uncharacterized protein LOC131163332 isoform X2 [Malania oleifera]|uniref:uncharacterized protein LOC131163332 isoform X2 n=1 Tax=Malania oleifera TaxID=397392 RepID=UPI0025AEA4BF|nr:uncharacterized protein LOC131163332 isoform X2 [Malania oleifera]XP_057975890.1 uncharacterized protein LOC131163332 isoform X2 [Malania oleifera]